MPMGMSLFLVDAHDFQRFKDLISWAEAIFLTVPMGMPWFFFDAHDSQRFKDLISWAEAIFLMMPMGMSLFWSMPTILKEFSKSL